MIRGVHGGGQKLRQREANQTVRERERERNDGQIKTYMKKGERKRFANVHPR